MRKYLVGFLAAVIIFSIPVTFAIRSAFYRDVPNNEWYTDAVNEMTQLGLFDGYPDGTFRPGNFVNRAELAQVLQQLVRVIEESSGVELNLSDSDASASQLSESSSGGAGSSGSILPGGTSSSGSGNTGSAGSSGSVLPPSSSASSNATWTAATFNENYRTPLERSLNFITTKLANTNGAIYATLETDHAASSVVGVNHEVLSESYGLIFNALAYVNQPALFQRYYEFFIDRVLADNNFAYWKLNEDLTVYQDAMAMIDDMKIIKGLLKGYERFGIARYRDTALAMANAIKTYGLRNGSLVNHVSWNANGKYAASHLVLGYPDLEVTRMLAAYDSSWNTIHQNTVNIIKGGQMSNGLFEHQYNFDRNYYSHEGSLEMIFQAYTFENLALAGETAAARKFLDFVKNEFEDNGRIYARYTSGGRSAVDYQDLAVYAIIARGALTMGDNNFAAQIIGKIIDLQIDRSGSNVYGAFLWGEDEDTYSFSQINSLYSLAKFSLTNVNPSNPPADSGSGSSGGSGGSGVWNITHPVSTPGMAPEITSRNFVLWHLADVYYGSYDAEDFTLWVQDMNDVTWHKALISGDISGDGSVRNFTDMKNIFLTYMRGHLWGDLNFLAGNHEYNCGGTPADGCLDNYKNIINSNLRYTWDYGNIHFIVMSTDAERNRMSNATMQWLRNEVAVNQDKILILSTHHMPHVLYAEPAAEDILAEFGIDMWLFGHAHCAPGDSACNRHGALGDFYVQDETTFVDAGHISHMASRYLIFEEGSNQVRILSRNHETRNFQPEFSHTQTLRYPFRR